MIYSISICISILFSLLVQQKKEKNIINGSKIIINKRNLARDIMIIFSGIFPFFLSAFRYGIGTDYFYTYIPQFKRIIDGERSYYEIGFYWLNKIIGMFTSNGQVLIVVTSLIFIGIVYSEIYRYSRQYWLSILLFYLSFVYFISLNNIRQSIASAVLLIATELLVRNHKVGFVCCTILAASFHQIAILFLVFLLIEKVCLSTRMYTFIVVVFWCACKFIMPIVISKLINYIPRFRLYFTADELSVYSDKTIGLLLVFIQFLILLYLNYIEFIYKPDNSKVDMVDKREWNIIKLNQCLLLCVYAVDGIVPATYRIARIFSFSQFLFIPNVIFKYEKNRRNRWIEIGIVLILFGVLFYENFITGAEEVFPYISIFK